MMTSLSGRDSCHSGRHAFPLLLSTVAILFSVVSSTIPLAQVVGIAELSASFSLFPRLLVLISFLTPVGKSDLVPTPVVNALFVPAPVAKLDLELFEFGWVPIRVVAILLVPLPSWPMMLPVAWVIP